MPFHAPPKPEPESIGSLVDKILSHIKTSAEPPATDPVTDNRFTARVFDTPNEFWTRVVARGAGKDWRDRAQKHQECLEASPANLIRILDESIVLQAIDELSWASKVDLDRYLRSMTASASPRLSSIIKSIESGAIEFRELPDGTMLFRPPLQTADVSELTRQISKLEGQVSSLTSQLVDKEEELRKVDLQTIPEALVKDADGDHDAT